VRYLYISFLPLILMIVIHVAGDGYIQMAVGLIAVGLSLVLTAYGIIRAIRTRSDLKKKKLYYRGAIISLVPLLWWVAILIRRITEQ
jgi:hypothetical protein